MKNKRLLNLRINPEVLDDLNKISTILEIPYSQIIREAIREKIAELRETHPLLRNNQTEVALRK